MTAGSSPQSRCQVSLIVACRNLSAYIDAAIHSARAQTVPDIEILIVDDRSTDDSRARAAAHAAADPRVRILDGPGLGPAPARNVALKAARGDWIGILDGDDFMHPRRLEMMLGWAEAGGFDIVADNLLAFYDPPEGRRPHLLIEERDAPAPRRIELACYIESNRLFSSGSPLGYLKPLIRRDTLLRGAVGYNDALRIGEDYDLIARLLAAGASFGYYPIPLYFYRRHPNSTSYRMASADVDAMIAAAQSFHRHLATTGSPALEASARRLRSLWRARHFSAVIEALKRRNPVRAAATLLAHPGTIPLLSGAISGGIVRRVRGRMRRGAPITPSMPRTLAFLREDAGVQEHADEFRLILPDRFDLAAEPSPIETILLVCGYGPIDTIRCESPASRDLLPFLLSPNARIEPCGNF